MELRMEELVCQLSDLIVLGDVKGYISYSKNTLFAIRTNAFPALAAVRREAM